MAGGAGAVTEAVASDRPAWDFRERPLLVFWETTRACPLACRHCRATAMPNPLPGELDPDEAGRFLDSLEDFGRPSPLLVLTGGDVLSRPDVDRLVARACEAGLRVTLAPTVSPALTEARLQSLADLGVAGISISLDGEGSVHDGIRGVQRHAERTCEAIRQAVACGLRVQVNTCVMRDNVHQLPEIFARVRALRAEAWEVFFLVKVGRGTDVADLRADACEACAHFLYDASRYGLATRTVEAPFFRRVVRQREAGGPPPDDPLYEALSARLSDMMGPPGPSRAQSLGTRDGNGIVFVAHDGTIQPGGFLPISCGSVRRMSLRSVYQSHRLFRALRTPEDFRGRCGVCEYRDLCGGSRARAYAAYGDPLEEDPACAYVPAAWTSNRSAAFISGRHSSAR